MQPAEEEAEGEAGLGGGAEKEKKRNHQKNEGYTYFCMLNVKCSPANTFRQNDVLLTSKRRRQRSQ